MRARVCVVPSCALQRSERQSDTSVRVVRDCRVYSSCVYATRSERSVRRSIVRPLTVSRESRASPKQLDQWPLVLSTLRDRVGRSPRSLCSGSDHSAPIYHADRRNREPWSLPEQRRQKRRIRSREDRRFSATRPRRRLRRDLNYAADLRDLPIARGSASTFRRRFRRDGLGVHALCMDDARGIQCLPR